MKDLPNLNLTPLPTVLLNVGRVAGKLKMTLVDQRDAICENYFILDVKMILDKNGNGGKVMVVANDKGSEKYSRYLHDIIWEHYNGPIPQDWRVIHRNRIGMDNRLLNLMLVHKSCLENNAYYRYVQMTSNDEYYKALTEVSIHHFERNIPLVTAPLLNSDGVEVKTESPVSYFYECYYPLCIKTEIDVFEFKMCSKCKIARYCGPECQKLHWPVHRCYCKTPSFSYALSER